MSSSTPTPITDRFARWPDQALPDLGRRYHDLWEEAHKMERELALAQTEIKGHMRVKDDLEARVAVLEKALRIIERWSEFPATGDFHEGGTPVSYGAAFGSNGERDYMRSIASAALKDRA